jgi:F-type H+-transporting ATPase subunit gamma
MATLKEVRKRISSVKSTQKITRAMKMVSAAKLRRAQDNIVAARPFAAGLQEIVAQIAANAGPEPHPFMVKRTVRNPVIVVLTSDRGLCGGFNSNACRTAQRSISEGMASQSIDGYRLAIVGKKGREHFSRRNFEIASTFAGVTNETAGDRAQEIALAVSALFLDGAVDGVRLVYNEFRSAVSQQIVTEQLLPIEATHVDDDQNPPADFACEPGITEILTTLLPQYLQSRIHRALLESIASEFGARMTAMENATKNAKDMIERLSLAYNRARQAAITKELMEIVSGAEALKG